MFRICFGASDRGAPEEDGSSQPGREEDRGLPRVGPRPRGVDAAAHRCTAQGTGNNQSLAHRVQYTQII